MTAETVFSRFEIDLDAGEGVVFHGGELITGNLRIQLKRPMTINVIKLQLKGRAAFFNETGKNAEVEKVYFDRDITLLERPPGRPEPGHFPWIADFLYSLPFECPLPNGCPTSYEGPQAFIRYFARATIVEEMGNDTAAYMVKKAFNVIAKVEGSVVSVTAQQPVAASETSTFGGCCCRGKLTAELSLPKSVYSPGEAVIGSLAIDNRHPRYVVEQVEVRLIDRVSRVGTTSGKSTSRILVHRRPDKTDVVKCKTQLQRDDVFFLHIPSVPPTTAGASHATAPDIYALAVDGASPQRTIENSPSTATLKYRKQPFIRVDYALQVSLGNHLLLELPIYIEALPVSGPGIVYQPFVAGAQSISESDEHDKKLFNGPFVFTPLYPVQETHQVNGK